MHSGVHDLLIIRINRKLFVCAEDQLEKRDKTINSLKSHPGSGSDRTIASERQNTALAALYIGGSVTCSQKKTQGA